MSTQQAQAPTQTVLPGIGSRPWFLADFAGSAAIFLYVLSQFKYIVRDPLSSDLGLQGPLEALLIGLSFAFSLVACVMRRVVLPSPGVVLMLIYALFALLSSINSYYISFSAVKGLLLILTVGIAIGTSSAIGARAVIIRFYWSILAVIGLGFLMSLLLPDIFPLFRVDDSLRVRLWIFNNHPGVIADLVAVLLLLSPIIRPRPPIALQAGLFMLIFLTASRVSTVALLGLLTLGSIWDRRQNGMLIGVLIAGLTILLVGSLRARFSHLLERTLLEISTFNGRTFIWEFSLSLIREHPILGFGPDGLRDKFLHQYIWSSNSHNTYLEILLTSGWIGGGAFFFGWLLIVFRVKNLRDRSEVIAITLIHCYLAITGLIGGLLMPIVNTGLFIILILACLKRNESSYGKIEAR